MLCSYAGSVLVSWMVLFQVPARLRGMTVAGMTPVLDKWSGRDRKPVMTPSHPVITQQMQVIEMTDWTSFWTSCIRSLASHSAVHVLIWHSLSFSGFYMSMNFSQGSAQSEARLQSPPLPPSSPYCQILWVLPGFSWRACHLVKSYAEWVLSERTRCCSILMRS